MSNNNENYETQNVSLWILNDEGLYLAAADAVKRNGTCSGVYKTFIYEMCLENKKTPDGVNWLSNQLDYSNLDDMMCEIIN